MNNNGDNNFNPYTEWLEIPVEQQPPTLYQLIGVENFESDESRIDEASTSRAAELQQLAAGPNREVVQRLLSEVAKARRTLLQADARAAYDHSLRNPSTQPAASQRANAKPAKPSAANTFPGIQTEPAKASSPAAKKAASPEISEPNGSAPRAKKASSQQGSLKLHAISAGTLFVIVLGIVVVSFLRGGTERAATPMEVSDARSAASPSASRPKSQPSDSRSIGAAFDPKPIPGGSVVPGKMDLASIIPTNVGAGNSENTGSKNAGSSPGSSHGAVKTVKLSADWGSSLQVAESFDKISDDRFGGTTDAFTSSDGKLVVKPRAKGSRFAQLRCKKSRLKPNEAVSIDMNLGAKSEKSARIGLSIGTTKVAVVAIRQGLRVEHIKEKSSPIKLIGFDKSLPPDVASLRLTLIRGAESTGDVSWIVQRFDSSGKLKPDAWTGMITSDASIDPANVVIFVTRPRKAAGPSVWAQNLRTGVVSLPPAN